MSDFLKIMLTGATVTIAGALTNSPIIGGIGIIIMLFPIVATVLYILIALIAYLFIKD